MPSLRDIKQRIVSVKKTKKITQAMKMVAAAKFKRAQRQLGNAKIYGSALTDIASDLATRLEPDELPLLLAPNKSDREAVIIVSGDRGLCGGFNTYIMKAANEYLNAQDKDSVDLYLIGNKGVQHFKKRPYAIGKTYTHIVEKIDEPKVATILGPLVNDYLNGKYGKIVLFFNEFISALETKQKQYQVLPVQLDGWDISKVEASDYIYESEKSDVLEEFIKKQLSYSVLQALMESHAAEEGARMAAMDSASDNASEVISDLTLAYNRSRQAAITTELTEIVAGAASLN